MSTLLALQPFWPLRRSLATDPLPPLLDPPVSRTCSGLSKVDAMPSPSTYTGKLCALRTVVLQHGLKCDPSDKKMQQCTKDVRKCVLFYELEIKRKLPGGQVSKACVVKEP